MIEVEQGTDFCRTVDYKSVWGILTSPEIYPLIGDDYSPPWYRFVVNEHPDIWYLAVHHAGRLIGLFTLCPQNRVCWELHAVMLPAAGTRDKWQAARALPVWLAEHTECRRLTAAVPACNGPAIVYGTHGIGMRYVGRHAAAFMKGGQLHDLVLLGRSIGESKCRV